MRTFLSPKGIIIGLAVLFAAGVLALKPAIAARYVLAIGIDKYDNISSLRKAVGDARAVGAAMEGYGYKVIRILNPNRRQFNAGIARLVSLIRPGDTVVVHYSGHGVDISGQNYLLPADIPLPRYGVGSRDLVKNEAIRLQNLIERISNAGAKARIVIIDACRNNPFAQGGTRGVGTKAGLAPIDHAPAGTFIMYSAGVGQLALDRLGNNDREPTSVFTRIFLRHIGQKGQSIQALASQVRREVLELAERQSHLQRPAIYDNLLNSDRFSLRDGSVITSIKSPRKYVAPSATRQPALPTPALLPPPAKVAPAQAAPRPPDLARAKQAFKLASEINTVEAWQAFLEAFPDAPVMSFLARVRLKTRRAERAKAAHRQRLDDQRARDDKQRAERELRTAQKRKSEERARRARQKREAEKKRRAVKAASKSRSSKKSCSSLWYARNAIFARAGYCFKTKRGRRAFGRKCHPPYGKLSSASKRRVNAIKKQERRQRCR